MGLDPVAGSRTLTQADFEALLTWLDPDREKAAAKLLEIRAQLTRALRYRRSLYAEELADETINRVAGKVSEIRTGYAGDPALYFLGVARNVYRESLKATLGAPVARTVPDPRSAADDDALEYACLEQCMEALAPETRKLILDYYQATGGQKIDHRKQLARAYGINLTALRNRVHRIRSRLYECVSRCVDSKRGKAGYIGPARHK
jgi:DNA-directed RNA polymerase specialized sigma24 family protein